ncbi:MAG: hypothetical protein JW833_02910 [Prolixibacteraceae bacterium]|nr:hypothetical protein [Prolixibacteraceae bacterium]
MDDKLKTIIKTAWKKDDPLVLELINQVRQKVTGSNDLPMTQDDFFQLAEEIYNQCKTTISDRTLKEYLGHYSKRTGKCRLDIINAFAVYLGFKNFYEFKKEEENKVKKTDDRKPPTKLQDVPLVENNNVKKKKFRIISFTAIIITLLGLIIFIQLNQKPTENKKNKPELLENSPNIEKDSIQSEEEKSEEKNNIKEEKPENKNLAETEKIEPADVTDEYLNNLNTKFDIALLIIDENEQQENELMSQIAALYRNQGYSVTYSLFTTKFIQSEYLPELQNANSQVIKMLKTDTLINTIVLGEVTYSFRNGTLVVGTIICNATIKMNIISAIQKSLINSFSFSVNGNGVSESQAKEHAFSKLFDKFKEEYSSL